MYKHFIYRQFVQNSRTTMMYFKITLMIQQCKLYFKWNVNAQYAIYLLNILYTYTYTNILICLIYVTYLYD